jgi:pimeloyl-ACP methyl ester carboxylesterase
MVSGEPVLLAAPVRPLAAAGYRVVAPDQRGYARSGQPEAVKAYSMLHLAGDVLGPVHALGEATAVVVGHDGGAPVAWVTAMLRPDVVRAGGGPERSAGCSSALRGTARPAIRPARGSFPTAARFST